MPTALPVTVVSMNYASVVLVGFGTIVSVELFLRGPMYGKTNILILGRNLVYCTLEDELQRTARFRVWSRSNPPRICTQLTIYPGVCDSFWRMRMPSFMYVDMR